MIYLSFSLRNPWWARKHACLKDFVIEVNKNKTIELGFYKNDSIIGGGFSFTVKQSHAGFTWDLELLGYLIDFVFYDNRHWDSKNNCWESNNEQQN